MRRWTPLSAGVASLRQPSEANSSSRGLGPRSRPSPTTTLDEPGDSDGASAASGQEARFDVLKGSAVGSIP